MKRWLVDKATYAATLFGLKFGCLAIKILPHRWVFRFSDMLASLGFWLFRGFRNRSMANLTVALADRANGENLRTIAQRSLRNFFRACVEIGIALNDSDEELRATIPIDGVEHLDAALAKGHGVIILSAHLGNFFLLGSRLALENHPVSVLVNQPAAGKFAKFMDDYRLKVKQRTIHARPRRQALRELSTVLRSNEIAVMIADEYRKGSGIPLKLFGRTVLARRGPATLASRTGAAVIPAYVMRQPDDSLRLVIEPELQLVRSGKGKGEITENLMSMTQWLEKTVRGYPDQWNWMNIRWWDSAAATIVVEEPYIQGSTS